MASKKSGLSSLVSIPKTEAERRKITQDWLANCALENIYPSENALAEIELMHSGNMTTTELRAYLLAKHTVKTEST